MAVAALLVVVVLVSAGLGMSVVLGGVFVLVAGTYARATTATRRAWPT